MVEIRSKNIYLDIENAPVEPRSAPRRVFSAEDEYIHGEQGRNETTSGKIASRMSRF